MKPHDRRLIVKTVAIGVLLTALVTVAEIGQWLAPLERWLYDRRARDHQQFTPPPTDLLRHIDIDDRALEVIGQFPWPRSRSTCCSSRIRSGGWTRSPRR